MQSILLPEFHCFGTDLLKERKIAYSQCSFMRNADTQNYTSDFYRIIWKTVQGSGMYP